MDNSSVETYIDHNERPGLMQGPYLVYRWKNSRIRVMDGLLGDYVPLWMELA